MEVDKDPKLLVIIKGLETGSNEYAFYSLSNGRLLYKDHVVIPQKSAWVLKLIEEFHVTHMGGHSGAFRIIKELLTASIGQEYRKMCTNLWLNVGSASNRNTSPNPQLAYCKHCHYRKPYGKIWL